jgi:hypothetical protein
LYVTAGGIDLADFTGITKIKDGDDSPGIFRLIILLPFVRVIAARGQALLSFFLVPRNQMPPWSVKKLASLRSAAAVRFFFSSSSSSASSSSSSSSFYLFNLFQDRAADDEEKVQYEPVKPEYAPSDSSTSLSSPSMMPPPTPDSEYEPENAPSDSEYEPVKPEHDAPSDSEYEPEHAPSDSSAYSTQTEIGIGF